MSICQRHKLRLSMVMTTLGLMSTIFGLTSYKNIVQIILSMALTYYGVFLGSERPLLKVCPEIVSERVAQVYEIQRSIKKQRPTLEMP